MDTIMKLYLVQHAEALPKDVDPARPLSQRGRADAQQVADLLARAGLRVARVLHSGKKRAQQTAELLAVGALPGGKPEPTSGLNPNDPTDELAARASQWDDDTMVVGHLPYMARLASCLLTGDETSCLVAFTPGTVLCLEQAERGRWCLAWMIRPELSVASKLP